MSAIPSTPSAAGDTPAAPPRRRWVSDAPTRMFHWLFALSFAGAYLSAESERWRALHVTLGYGLAGLFAFRLLYGLLGPRQLHPGVLLRKLAGLPAWLRAAAAGDIRWRQGQNLLMAAAVLALLALVLPLTLSGYASYQDWGGEWLEELHEFFGNSFLALVLAHIGLILGLSLLRRQNQALPMLGGHVAGPGPDLLPRQRRGLAAALLLALLAFGAWQWQASPTGLLPDKTWHPEHRDGHGDDDD